ncbi:MAG TPA: TVP38/TMEM64 family protein [Thermodesulfobacteriota bacterium]|nr:TVP38/TMEM64 family protein [Thermodesulfobacteriota bacterium]
MTVSSGNGTERPKGGLPWIRLLVIVVVIAAVGLVLYQAGLLGFITQGTLKERVERLDGVFQSLGPWAPAAFLLMWIVCCILLVPGLPVTIAGALVFGAFWGSVWTAIGANLGAAAAFLVGRYAARGMVAGWIEKNKSLKKIDEGVRQQGWRMLMITRLVPIFPFSIQNYVYGLTDIPFRTYLLVTFPTILPGTIAFNFAAGSAREVILSGGQPEGLKRTIAYLAVAAVFFVVVYLIPGWIRKRYGDVGKSG